MPILKYTHYFSISLGHLIEQEIMLPITNNNLIFGALCFSNHHSEIMLYQKTTGYTVNAQCIMLSPACIAIKAQSTAERKYSKTNN